VTQAFQPMLAMNEYGRDTGFQPVLTMSEKKTVGFL
jgi:hypothetical protein